MRLITTFLNELQRFLIERSHHKPLVIEICSLTWFSIHAPSSGEK